MGMRPPGNKGRLGSATASTSLLTGEMGFSGGTTKPCDGVPNSPQRPCTSWCQADAVSELE